MPLLEANEHLSCAKLSHIRVVLIVRQHDNFGMSLCVENYPVRRKTRILCIYVI